MMKTVSERLALLRAEMAKEHIDTFLIPSDDPHNSEYVAECFRAREYFSGFTGSAGTLVVRQDEAGLWTDGRYFIQAQKELNGSGIDLYRMGEPQVPTITAFLQMHMPSHSVLGFNGRCVSASQGKIYASALTNKDITIRADLDLAGSVWENRPAYPCEPVSILDASRFAGESVGSKLKRVRSAMENHKALHFVTSKLDEIMWLFNIRGNDVKCNPVALSYAVISKDEAFLFLQHNAVSNELKAYALENEFSIREYDSFSDFLKTYRWRGGILADPAGTSYSIFEDIRQNEAVIRDRIKKDYIIRGASPVERMKAVKNETEIRNMREVYIEDSVVLTKFLFYLQKNVKTEQITEGMAARKLDSMRSEIKDFKGLSFDTISAYGSNAAMMHYSHDKNGGAVLKPEGMYLVDSGGQYLRGTTDVTRTISLGPVTEEMKRCYTLTAVSQLQLMTAVFIKGCSGISLDVLAREPMWEVGMDYKCGTGHGIGYMLNVHEGPHSIRYKRRSTEEDTPMEVGMVVSDEPGVYREGLFGIRTETILTVVPRMKTPDGEFLGFEPLTFVPLDPELIDLKFLTPKTRTALNEYHKQVLEKIGPYMDREEFQWLREQCRTI